MENYINAVIMGETKKVLKTTRLSELSKDYQCKLKYPIILAKVNNEIQELLKTLSEDCNIDFLDITDSNGFRTYQRSLVFMMITAAKEIINKKARVVMEHSINKNLYCEIMQEGLDLTDELLSRIEKRMTEMSEENITIEKLAVPLEQALLLAEEQGLHDKVSILKYRRTSSVNLYKLNWFYDYFYGPLVPSTGYLKSFKLVKENKGFFLQLPSSSNPSNYYEIGSNIKITGVFNEASAWARILKVDTVGALNDIMCSQGIGDIIRITEALHEKKLAKLADEIYDKNKNIVLIAGPSSSGKTTFAQRLCVQLRVNGLMPYVISLDNYFVGKDKTPVDEYGQIDYESLGAIDVEQINEDLSKLLAGETVDMPVFNFISGKREYKGNYLKIKKGDCLLIEGIHGLNEKVTSQIPKANKYKIFISALTQLNLDDHNRITTTDTRVIRRIVRDNKYRGTDAAATLNMWPSVLRGESKNIFPYQEDADGFFNSALVYEMCVLKQFAEPLLFGVPKSLPQYTEARRLIKFLDSFLGISSEGVPPNSILREFIGGSCFNA